MKHAAPLQCPFCVAGCNDVTHDTYPIGLWTHRTKCLAAAMTLASNGLHKYNLTISYNEARHSARSLRAGPTLQAAAGAPKSNSSAVPSDQNK